MTKSRITAPPWDLISGTGYAGNYEIPAAVNEEHEANARLIKSAPDLFLSARAAFRLLIDLRERGVIAHAPVIEALGAIIAYVNDDTLALRALRAMATGTINDVP